MVTFFIKTIMDINARIAIRIKALRNQKGYKAEIVGQELEMSKAAYSQLENEKIDITLTKLQKITDYFSVPIASILQENSGATFNIEKVENSTINGTQINNYTDKELLHAFGQSIDTMHKVMDWMKNKSI
jgi:transcriptional regulator with XRE-family HTH domain